MCKHDRPGMNEFSATFTCLCLHIKHISSVQLESPHTLNDGGVSQKHKMHGSFIWICTQHIMYMCCI